MRPEGLSRDRRVRRRSEFTRTYAEGKKIVVRPFVLFVRANDSERSRIGVTATRKLGGAVVRNRAKRLVRETFRKAQDVLPRGYDFVVVARAELLSLGPDELRPLLVAAAARAVKAEATP